MLLSMSLFIIYKVKLPVVRPRSCQVIYYSDTPTLGRMHQLFDRVIPTQKRNHNVIPYNYGYASNIETPHPLFQTEISGLTRSGRCFTLEELKKAKGKEVADQGKELEVNRPVTEEKSNEFLKLIKHSEYCILNQLKKTPARISLMSLILSFDLHRNALQKVLNEVSVPQDIEQKTM